MEKSDCFLPLGSFHVVANIRKGKHNRNKGNGDLSIIDTCFRISYFRAESIFGLLFVLTKLRRLLWNHRAALGFGVHIIPNVFSHSTADATTYASPNKSSRSTAGTATDAPPKASSCPTANATTYVCPNASTNDYIS